MTRVIDCDVRLAAPPVSALREHLEELWRDVVTERGVRSLEPSSQLPAARGRRAEPAPGAELAILNPVSAVEALHSEDLAAALARGDRKSTRLNSSHVETSYAVFCLKKKKKKSQNTHQGKKKKKNKKQK